MQVQKPKLYFVLQESFWVWIHWIQMSAKLINQQHKHQLIQMRLQHLNCSTQYKNSSHITTFIHNCFQKPVNKTLLISYEFRLHSLPYKVLHKKTYKSWHQTEILTSHLYTIFITREVLSHWFNWHLWSGQIPIRRRSFDVSVPCDKVMDHEAVRS